jgi:hypothetical protein
MFRNIGRLSRHRFCALASLRPLIGLEFGRGGGVVARRQGKSKGEDLIRLVQLLSEHGSVTKKAVSGEQATGGLICG